MYEQSDMILLVSSRLHNQFRCKAAQTETILLFLKSDSHPVIAVAALDEAVDHFGQQMIYLLLPPHADIQREFLDRVRINSIKHYQAILFLAFDQS